MNGNERIQTMQTDGSGLDELVRRSRLLGEDRSVCNFGGGNTSSKVELTDFRGRLIDVLWVKGSGSDLAAATTRSFTALRLDDVLPLFEREQLSDEAMVAYLERCMLDPHHPRASIETLLHAFLPFAHVDHTHPDAIISLCCAPGGRELAAQIFGDRMVWVPYIRPGFELSKMIAQGVASHPHAELVLMEKHGLVTWGDTSESCQNKTLSVIKEASEYIAQRASAATDPTESPFGRARVAPLSTTERQALMTSLLPVVRGAIGQEKRMLTLYDDSDAVLEFVCSHRGAVLSQVGAACPDHLVHTKRVPLWVDWTPGKQSTEDLVAAVQTGIRAYQNSYQDYFQRHREAGDVLSDTGPRVILIPGVGMINTGKSWVHADISRQLYHRAIAVMRGAVTLGGFVSLSEQESYKVEYWPLELYKLSLAPPEGELARQVGLVTGGAGGIGSATCRKLAAAGMHLVIADLNLDGARTVADEINSLYGPMRALAVDMDVTQVERVEAAFTIATATFGGVDLIVNNAGLATSSPLDETTLAEWNLTMNVLATGYFLVAKTAFGLMKRQGTGGTMVFIGSKNSVYAGKNVAAYSTAKAAETHLARCIAAEGGEYGIRVNSILPDAVLQGSQIWNSTWRQERAATYGIAPDELDDHYRKRTVLHVNVVPDDIAEGVLFFASARSAKTTGCMLTVDGGVAAAFTR